MSISLSQLLYKEQPIFKVFPVTQYRFLLLFDLYMRHIEIGQVQRGRM
jgi:hypothetical protein